MQVQHLVDWSPHISLILHHLLYATTILSLAGPNFRGRRRIFTTLLITLTVASQLKPRFTSDFDRAQPYHLAWVLWFGAIEKLLKSEDAGGPEAHFWRVDKPAREATSYRAFGWHKVRWAAVLLLNLRGIRWNFQVKNVPPPVKTRSRAEFLRTQAVRLCYHYVAADLFGHLTSRFLYCQPLNPDAVTMERECLSYDGSASIRSSSWPWLLAKAFVFGATPYHFLSFQYTLMSMVAVITGLSSIEDWPPLFGSVAQVTTVRYFWGSFWQQIMRRIFTSCSTAAVDWLGIPHGTNTSSYVQLYTAFFVSGVMHGNAMRTLPMPESMSEWEIVRGVMVFFFLQPVAISFEDFCIWCFKSTETQGATSAREENSTHKSPPSSVLAVRPWLLEKTVGRFWIWAWLMWSMSFAVDASVRLGIGKQKPPLLSIASPIIDYFPIAS